MVGAVVILWPVLLIVGLFVYRAVSRHRPAVKIKYYNQPADYLSYGEVERTPGCRCRPSNVLYWELSPAITDDCPIHGPS